MNIREFSDKDYPRVLEIYAHSKLDELRFEKEIFTLLPLEEDEERLASLKESEIYVYDDGQVLGYGAIFESEIRALFVCPTARGKGIARAILEFLLSQLGDKANLYVAKTNIPAKKLYESYGFTVCDEFLTNYNGKPVFANKMVRLTGKC